MASGDSDEWSRARLARDQLEKELLGNPNVQGVDISFEPAPEREAGQRLVVRVAVAQIADSQLRAVPSEIALIPVRIVVAPSYRLE